MPRKSRSRLSQRSSRRKNQIRASKTLLHRSERRSWDPVVRLERLNLDLVKDAINARLVTCVPRQVTGYPDSVTPACDPVILLKRLDLGKRQAVPSQITRHPPVPTEWDPVVRLDQLDELRTPEATQMSRIAPHPRRRHTNIRRTRNYRDALTAGDAIIEALADKPHHLGPLTDGCKFCHAHFFYSERQNREQVRFWCCCRGKIDLPPLQPCPDELRALLTEQGPLQRQFREHIRTVNSNFAMASFKTSQPLTPGQDQGHWCFHACGDLYHFAEGPTTDDDLRRPKLNQYYYIEPAAAIQHRHELIGDRVDRETIATLEKMLRRTNLWVKSFRFMARVQQKIVVEERRRGRDAAQVIDKMVFVLKDTADVERRNFAMPKHPNEVAAVYFDEDPPDDIQLKLLPKRPGMHNEIKNLNRLADPMVYPLLFPYGEYGYDIKIKYRTKPSQTVSIRQFYRYRLYTRDEFSIIHHGGKLFQQYIVDAWIRAEASDLWYLKQNQQKFRLIQQRVMQYHGNAQRSPGDAQNTALQDVGRPLILYSGFQGGQRNHRRQYLDAMATVARHGKPDLFVTFTCNPGWPEIVQNLHDHQRFQDRMDLVCRVFELKLQALLHEINLNQIFGVVLSYMYVIEFQKRGLPHAHIVLTFIDQDKIENEQDVDRIVCARIPDKDKQPKLYDIVKNFYVHMPCGKDNPKARCMQDGECTKFYPKDYTEVTLMNPRGTGPFEYKRPEDGRTVSVANTHIDNRRIVPYNPYVAAKYHCHTNVEVCGSLASIKYLHKYVQKGSDHPTIEMNNARPQQRPRQSENMQQQQAQPPQTRDEIQEYINRRHVSSAEAAWRLFEFKMHDRSHAVIVLPVHLENDKTILIDEAANEQQLNDTMNRPSKLEAAFTLNASDASAREKFYIELPEYYVWESKICTWRRRARVRKVIGAVAEVSPQPCNMELFYMRMLLMHKRAPTSFQDLRTIEGRHFDTYKEACEAMHLLENADEYDRCLRDAAVKRSPGSLRQLFAMLCCVTDANFFPKLPGLWQKYLDSLVDDYIRHGCSRRQAVCMAYDDVNGRIKRNKYDIDLAHLGICVQRDANTNMPQMSDADEPANVNVTYLAENLNQDQQPIYEEIMQVVRQASRTTRQSNVFFLDGPGGTGKTYLYNCILSELKKQRIETIAVAWTGIAAALLQGGKTSHNAFGIPLKLDDKFVAGWPLEHIKSKRMKRIALIIWDEASMIPKQALMAVDRYLKDLFKTSASMGGVVTLFGGDFRQILPVITRGHRMQAINTTIKMCQMWRDVKHRKLTINMRAMTADPTRAGPNRINNMTYPEFLLEIGQGTYPNVQMKSAPFASDDLIELPQILIVPDLDSLLDFVYGDFTETQDLTDIGSKALLCPTNVAVDNINATILARLTGAQEKRYFSVDKYDQLQGDELHITDDVLHSTQPASLPPHELILRVGCVVMLLKNLDLSVGLCNGMRMKVVELQENFIEVEILTGANRGTTHLLPKINITCSDTALPRDMHRFQFPVKLAYAITINKAQGQTFNKVGVYLNKPCFSHGQLYVALSRVGNCHKLKVCVEDSVHQGKFHHTNRCFTRNVVYKQMFEEKTVDLHENDQFESDLIDVEAFEDAGMLSAQSDVAQPHNSRVSVGDRPGTSGLQAMQP